MSIGTFVVSGILLLIVIAIIASMVKKKKQGKHIGCDNCGGCQGTHHAANSGCQMSDGASHSHHHDGGCSCADKMVAQMEQQLANQNSKH